MKATLNDNYVERVVNIVVDKLQNSKDGIFYAEKIVGRALDDINLKLCVC